MVGIKDVNSRELVKIFVILQRSRTCFARTTICQTHGEKLGN